MGTQSLSICQKTTKAEQHTVWWPIQLPNSEGRCAPTQLGGSRNGNSGIRKRASLVFNTADSSRSSYGPVCETPARRELLSRLRFSQPDPCGSSKLQQPL